MTTQDLILYLAVGLLAGWLAGRILKAGGFGLVGDLVIGVIGSFVGVWLFGVLQISAGGLPGLLIASVAGALLLLYLARLVKTSRR
jgi:uncharacterized membrane protein YeaQ/YmgE (transglycosylase-associated protein family)